MNRRDSDWRKFLVIVGEYRNLIITSDDAEIEIRALLNDDPDLLRGFDSLLDMGILNLLYLMQGMGLADKDEDVDSL
jgi:hypothetical protein